MVDRPRIGNIAANRNQRRYGRKMGASLLALMVQ
jgi:hypothetical protein